MRTTKVVRMLHPRQARDRARFIETMRQQIPVDVYLKMLHHAACTGDMPNVDPDTGKLNGTANPVSPAQRIEITQYLLDKALPDLKRLEPVPNDGATEEELNQMAPTDVRAMSTPQIMALITAGKEITDAQFRAATDAVAPSGAGPTGAGTP